MCVGTAAACTASAVVRPAEAQGPDARGVEARERLPLQPGRPPPPATARPAPAAAGAWPAGTPVPSCPPMPTPATTGGQGARAGLHDRLHDGIEHALAPAPTGSSRNRRLIFSLPKPMGATCHAHPVARHEGKMHDRGRIVPGVLARERVQDGLAQIPLAVAAGNALVHGGVHVAVDVCAAADIQKDDRHARVLAAGAHGLARKARVFDQLREHGTRRAALRLAVARFTQAADDGLRQHAARLDAQRAHRFGYGGGADDPHGPPLLFPNMIIPRRRRDS